MINKYQQTYNDFNKHVGHEVLRSSDTNYEVLSSIIGGMALVGIFALAFLFAGLLQ